VTEKQEQRLKDKIKNIKKALAADKKRWGGYYDDSGGLRYAPPEIYMKLKDYKGALRYFNWFDKNFPDDSGNPGFFFEYTLTLFKRNYIEKAEKKALKTFLANPYLLDYFLERKLMEGDINSYSGWHRESLEKFFIYNKTDNELQSFAQWLETFIESSKFLEIKREFLEIEKKLQNEPKGHARCLLIKRRFGLLDDI
jgi:tetratricopeptide (TPR) repeat protein